MKFDIIRNTLICMARMMNQRVDCNMFHIKRPKFQKVPDLEANFLEVLTHSKFFVFALVFSENRGLYLSRCSHFL